MKAERDTIFMGKIYLRGAEMPKEFKPKDKKAPVGAATLVTINRPANLPVSELDDNPLTRTYDVDELRAMDMKSLKAVAKHRDLDVEPTEGWTEAAERDQIIDKILTQQKAGNTPE